MTNSDMQRRIFISYAADDPDWRADRIEAVASAIREAGPTVRLDLWRLRDRRRQLSLAEWQEWMDTSIDGATHILCLVSARYCEMWNRSPNTPGGFGIAFQSTSLIRQLYLRREQNDGLILTLRPDNLGFDSIPSDLVFHCPSYRWMADRSLLLSHLAGAEAEFSSRLSDGRLSGGLILDGLRYPDSSGENDASEQKSAAAESSIEDRTDGDKRESVLANEKADIVELFIEVKLDAVLEPGLVHSTGGSEFEVPRRPSSPVFPPLGPNGLWPAEDEWRAPLGDFPPPWASAWGDDLYGLWADLAVNGVTQRMRWIEPSGSQGFLMGSTKKERAAIKDKSVREWPNRHEHEPKLVPIKPGFWLADTPCTQAFWQAVTGDNPSHFHEGGEAPERPVENVSWEVVDEHFVKRFAQTPDWGTDDRLCLPDEEQWEYAARAGSPKAYWWGDDWDDAHGNADGKIGQTTPVKRYPANPWGLHDIHGNVWEWCRDPWQPRRDAPEARPDEDARVVRGGSWLNHPGFARAAYRGSARRRDAYLFRGFRFALRSPAGPEAL